MPLDTSKQTMQQIGNYDLLAKLAEGGMGTVYKARSKLTGNIVAIKIVPATTSKSPVLLRRFEQEFRAASALDHPNVVRAIEYCGTGATPFLVMEFVDGESVGQRIERDGPIPEEESIRLMAQVCQGLNKAHKLGLIHRDVKPDNIMVTRDGIAKLTDLGLVKDVEGELNLTRTGRGLGTPHFMAPEQFRNAKNVDVRCDIYSLGATLYMMVTGQVPFGKVGPLDCWMKKVRNDFIPPKELNPRITDRVDWAIRRSMSADPEKRPASCREFVEDLHGKQIRQPVILAPAEAGGSSSTNSAEVWYLVYKDENHETHTVKGTTEGIRRALKDQLLGDAGGIRACRTKTGPFQTLDSFPEFRDLVVVPAPLPPTGGQSTTPTPTQGKQTTPPPASSQSWRGMPVPPRPVTPDPDSVDLSGRGARSGRLPASNEADNPKESRPHIPIERKSSQPVASSASDWWLWLIVLAIALATALSAVFLLPKLTS